MVAAVQPLNERLARHQSWSNNEGVVSEWWRVRSMVKAEIRREKIYYRRTSTGWNLLESDNESVL